MELDDYFTFAGPDDIRLAGSRVGVEQVLYQYIYKARTAEEIADHFPTLTLEQVYATILYYLWHRPQMEAYLTDWLAWSEEQRQAQEANPAWRELAEHLRQERERRQAMTAATAG
jgi:uncharacterized protein (DUF433 family)